MGLKIRGKNVYQLEKKALITLRNKLADIDGYGNRSLIHCDSFMNDKKYIWVKNHAINEDLEGEEESKPETIAKNVRIPVLYP